ncbi:family 20 glycosylhydrolase [Plantibacter sp. YIM 135347]|uniref:family 20 glycosylhydrolase n=1 Tax=Plantibacter sp. YIM 135347 TaxID=3423919 RepID=UPI003D332C3C
MARVIPQPASVVVDAASAPFTLTSASRIIASPDAASVADLLASALRTSTGYPLAVVRAEDEPADGREHDIRITAGPASVQAGTGLAEDESYRLSANESGVDIVAAEPAGAFAAVQTLRQLLPAANWSPRVQAVAWTVKATTVEDAPRFPYRGAMLDVARHFFTVAQVQRFIDQIAALKINVLHLHLTDDQGWRLHIDSWPELTGVGASTNVNGAKDGKGGFYTADDYRAIVDYAAARFITIVPEVDVPGHTNAALASYAELNADGVAPAPYEGTEVGFSTLTIGAEITERFLTEVLGEVAAATPGPFLHIGGDESHATKPEDFLAFVEQATGIAAATGKTVIGWHEMGKSPALVPGTIGQYWNYLVPQEGHAEELRSFVDQGGKAVMSPADVAYVDMKYTEDFPLGLTWAEGPTSVEASYGWDPAAIVEGVTEESILGVEAPLWTETVVSSADIESLVFPRLASVAETGWSAAGPKDWSEFRSRLAELGQDWTAAGVAFHRSPEVDWSPKA